MELCTYPLHSITMEQAKALQFKVIDTITRHFDGREVLSLGDLGVVPGLNKPTTTQKAEAVIAEVFGAEGAQLVRGSGTGALRWALLATLKPGDTLLVHAAPIYPTTKVTIDGMCLKVIEADFNFSTALARVLEEHGAELKGALVQHTRQKPDDSYDLETVIGQIKKALPDLPVITDDNYAAMKVEKIGCQAGADLATFSCFKVLGPEGVGVLLGKKKYVEAARAYQYSGGSQVQGHEAMAALRGLVYAPVALAALAEAGFQVRVHTAPQGGGSSSSTRRSQWPITSSATPARP